MPRPPSGAATTGTGAPAWAIWLSTGVHLAGAALAIVLLVHRGWYRLDHVPRRTPAFELHAGPLLFIGMLVAGVAGASVPLPEMTNEVAAHALRILAVYGGQGLVVATYLLMRGERRRVASPTRTRPAVRTPLAVLTGVGACLLWWPLVVLASWLALQVMRIGGEAATDPIAHQTLTLLNNSATDGWYVVLALAVCLGAPIVEEVMYRGIAQETLDRLTGRRWGSIVLVSAVFAVMHMEVARPDAIAGLFVLALGLGWVYERTGRLAASIAMHAAFNIGNLALASLTT